MKLLRPRTVAEAVAAIAASERPILYAGGIEVLMALRSGAIAGDTLIDTKRIDGAVGVCHADALIRIGPATRHHAVAGDPLIRAHLPLLAAACAQLGTTRIRMQGTLGGNFANGHQHTDPGTAAMVYGGHLRLMGAAGVREVALAEFWRGPGVVARTPDELVESIHLRPLPEGWTVVHERVEVLHRPPTAVVSVAAHLIGDQVSSCRIAAGAVARTPMRLPVVEDVIVGCDASCVAAAIADCSALVADAIDAESDALGSASFKVDLVVGLIQRAMSQLLGTEIVGKRP